MPIGIFRVRPVRTYTKHRNSIPFMRLLHRSLFTQRYEGYTPGVGIQPTLPRRSCVNSVHGACPDPVGMLKATLNLTQRDPAAHNIPPNAPAVAPLEPIPQFLSPSGTLPANLILSTASLRRVHIVSYEHLRRSSRIPKEVAILLTGSDMDGKGFSEMTKTVLLSRHGAGIISAYKFSAEQEIIVRYLDTNKEALVRVVGGIGSEGDVYTYGVAFVDPATTNFWDIDFSPTSEQEKEARRLVLECGNCKDRETVEHSEVESDVFLANEEIVRYCKYCRDSTLWKRAADVVEDPSVLVGAERWAESASTPVVTPEVKGGATSAVTPRGGQSSPDAPAPSAPPTPSLPSSPTSSLTSPAAQPASAYALAGDRVAAAPLDNRRKHTRTKVSYKACIRRSSMPDDIVTCEDMSKGGLCFKSRKQYYQRTAIEVAVPYAPGGNAIFVPAEIAWVVEIAKDKQYKCGVTYRRVSRA